MIGKGNQNNNFITMDKKKANGSYKRKRLSRDKFSHNRKKKRWLGVTIGYDNHRTNFFTMEEKKASGSYNRKRQS